MSCGAGHIIILSNSGALFSWGCNRLGQLGIGRSEKYFNYPVEIQVLRNKGISSIFCGAGHSFALDQYGIPYSWGASADFQTGHGFNDTDIYTPK